MTVWLCNDLRDLPWELTTQEQLENGCATREIGSSGRGFTLSCVLRGFMWLTLWAHWQNCVYRAPIFITLFVPAFLFSCVTSVNRAIQCLRLSLFQNPPITLKEKWMKLKTGIEGYNKNEIFHKNCMGNKRMMSNKFFEEKKMFFRILVIGSRNKI